MSAPTGPFRRSDRLLDSRDFRRVSRKGRRTAGAAFVMLRAKPGPGSQEGGRRIGISASRRVGNAVVRNHVKRRVREWFRRSREALPPGSDWVIIARPPAASLGGTEISLALDALVAKALRSDSEARR